MPKYNIDERQLAEDIEIVMEGKTYVIKKITADLMKQVTDIGKSNEIDAPVKQLAVLLGVESTEIQDVDIRKIGKALTFITQIIEKGISDLKNA